MVGLLNASKHEWEPGSSFGILRVSTNTVYCVKPQKEKASQESASELRLTGRFQEYTDFIRSGKPLDTFQTSRHGFGLEQLGNTDGGQRVQICFEKVHLYTESSYCNTNNVMQLLMFSFCSSLTLCTSTTLTMGLISCDEAKKVLLLPLFKPKIFSWTCDVPKSYVWRKACRELMLTTWIKR